MCRRGGGRFLSVPCQAAVRAVENPDTKTDITKTTTSNMFVNGPCDTCRPDTSSLSRMSLTDLTSSR